MDSTPGTAGGWLAQAVGTAIVSRAVVIVMALIGAALWNAGYIIFGALLLFAPGVGAVATIWTVVGSAIAAAATAAGRMDEDDA